MPSEASLANLQPWQPGQSGNVVRGRTRGYRRILSESRKLSFEALQTITACMRNEEAPWPSRLRAAEVILDRAWGEPDKHVQLDGASGIALLHVEFHGAEHAAPRPNGNGHDIIDIPLEPPE
jgi:hypothetical protein